MKCEQHHICTIITYILTLSSKKLKFYKKNYILLYIYLDRTEIRCIIGVNPAAGANISPPYRLYCLRVQK